MTSLKTIAGDAALKSQTHSGTAALDPRALYRSSGRPGWREATLLHRAMLALPHPLRSYACVNGSASAARCLHRTRISLCPKARDPIFGSTWEAQKMNKIWAWIKLIFDCPKGVICSRCLRLNFFFDDVGVYPRDREAMCRECHPTRP